MTRKGPDDVWPPIEKGRSVPGADRFGMAIFLVSLGIPFVVVIGSYFILKATTDSWLPSGVHELPRVLWISTGSLLLVSLYSHRSVKNIRIDNFELTKKALLAASSFVAVFTLCQVIAWEQVRLAFTGIEEQSRSYRAGFYLLTGFHALHVVGGMALQGWVLFRFYQRKYWSLHHPGLRYAAWYWHFLDGLWILIFIALLFG